MDGATASGASVGGLFQVSIAKARSFEVPGGMLITQELPHTLRSGHKGHSTAVEVEWAFVLAVRWMARRGVSWLARPENEDS